MELTKVAAVQAEPLWFDATGCVSKAAEMVREAGAEGAKLIGFGECWMGGYPFYIWAGVPAFSIQMHPFFLELATLGGASDPRWEPLKLACRESGVACCAGFNLKEDRAIWIAQILINGAGEIEWVRRKLKPTHAERTVYADGDGSDFYVTDVEGVGRVGALNCWEHLAPLSKFVQFSKDEEFHVGAWPNFGVCNKTATALSMEVNMAASQTYAVEGSCFFIACSSTLTEKYAAKLKELIGMLPTEGIKAFPDDPDSRYALPPAINPVEMGMLDLFVTPDVGAVAAVFGPDGGRMTAPTDPKEDVIVYADCPRAGLLASKATVDPTGHYYRGDVYHVVMDTTRRQGSERAVREVNDDCTTNSSANNTEVIQ
jgi:aliphatic nitrilase